MPVALIAHSLICKGEFYLVIKRSQIKRGEPNVYPAYWDIPGGRVEENELPRQAAVREALEETNQTIRLTEILHEDSQFDKDKQMVFTRLVYGATLEDEKPIQLDPEEHSDFRWIRSLEELAGESYVPYLSEVLPKIS